MGQTFVKQIEEAGLNAWPAVNQVLFDGWLLRFAGGYSKRVNSINLLWTSTLPLDEKIRYCEAVYRRLELPVIFRLVEQLAEQGLAEALDKAGYRSFDSTLVLGCKLKEEERVDPALTTRALDIESWVTLRVDLSGTDLKEWTVYREIIHCIIPEKILLGLFLGDRPVACGMGVVERHLLGYFSIYTAEDFRRQGYSQQVMQALTHWGVEKGASFGYLQVEADNEPALALYKKLGFASCYQYFYYSQNGV